MDYADHILPFQLLFRNINKIEIPNGDKELVKSRLKLSGFTSFRLHNHNSKINFIKNEQLALNNVSNDKKLSPKSLTTRRYTRF